MGKWLPVQQVTSRTPPKLGGLGSTGQDEQAADTWLGNALIRNPNPAANPGSDWTVEETRLLINLDVKIRLRQTS